MVHLPKSAGIYISKMYGRGKNKHYLGSSHCFHIDDIWALEGPGSKQKRKFVSYTKKFREQNPKSHYSMVMGKNPIKFSVLRNPFDILVSYYHSQSHGNKVMDGWHGCNIWGGYKNFKQFISHYCDLGTDTWNVVPLKGNLYAQLFDSEGNCCVDYILMYELLQKGLQFIESEFKLIRNNDMDSDSVEWKTFDGTSRNSTTNKKKDYRSYYTDKMREMVEKKCKWELDFGNYDFDGIKEEAKNCPVHQYDKKTKEWNSLCDE